MTMVDPVIDADLDAYVDGELDVTRRIAVESYLSVHPAAAAKVMADLSIRGELRLALADSGSAHGIASGRAETREAARRLERGLFHGRVLNSLQRMAAVAVLIGAGWVAHTSFGGFTATEVAASSRPPVYVDDAVKAFRAGEARAGGQAVAAAKTASGYNADDIRAATAIVMPSLPEGWQVAAAQIYPSEFGPSVEMTIDAGAERLSLFAVRPGSFAVQTVDHVALDGVQAAYWQIGEVAYALISKGSTANLDGQAESLARTLY